MKEELCQAFCCSLTVRDVPAGLAVGTGFRQSNGDAVGFYIVFQDKAKTRARIEDDGQTVPMLSASGVDVFNGSRAEIFSSLLNEAQASFDGKECVLHTPYLPVEQLPSRALSFVAMLVRMQDLLLLTRERVEETFKEDVLAAVRERFKGRAEILVDAPPTPSLAHFPADIVIKPPAAEPLALFVGTSEPKALEAYILWMQVQLQGESASKVMLVLDSAKPPKIKERTLARVMTSFQTAVFAGQEREAMDAMERALFGSVKPPTSGSASTAQVH
ncbi:DUF1828 domain-containing protein [Roseomonas chloroacetimidivorans]|uniref:DUF1828 domain-containing protein n=1 Tax=Roseomonas chloroacetimidivorans TaxID=1766656 RepID=UPI003C70B6F9